MASHEIRAMLPGMFYRKPSPEEQNYKEEGDAISQGDVIGLIEVMKSFHEVRSEFSGTVGKFQIGDADAVTPGQVLVVIED